MKKTGGMTSQVPRADTEYKETLNIFEGSFGLNTIEFMVPVMWSRGVNTGLITLPRLVQVLCENPAKIFGLYPQKGALMVGSDADVVIWDPSKQETISRPHGNGDFTSFEGFELLGMPVLVMQRGNPIIEDGEVVRKSGQARFLRSDPDVSAYAQKGYKVI
jgi:dihydropyrimidinase